MLQVASRKLIFAFALAALASPTAKLFAQAPVQPGSVTGTDPEPQSVVQQFLAFFNLA